MHNIQQRLDQLLVEAIDEVLGSLGEPVKNQVYMLLENDFAITKHILPQQIAEFSKFLYRMFGPQAKLIEIKCMKKFYSKIENDQQIGNRTMTFEYDDFTFLAYTDKFRAMFSREGV